MTAWASDPAWRLKLTVGIYAGWSAVATAGWGDVVASLSHAFSYDYLVPTASSVSGTNSAETGAVSVTVVGAAFGYRPHSIAARVGGSATLATTWQSDTAAVVKVAQGLGLSSAVDVTASWGTTVGTVSGVLTYDALVGSVSSVLLTNTAETGPMSVTVVGDLFGNAGSRARTSDG